VRHEFENGTVFHSPYEFSFNDSLEWKLRHNQDNITKEDMMKAATILHSFDVLIMMSQTKRNKILSKMKSDAVDESKRFVEKMFGE
jgi:chemotaxis methyl-accepting protein methylase